MIPLIPDPSKTFTEVGEACKYKGNEAWNTLIIKIMAAETLISSSDAATRYPLSPKDPL